MGIVKIRAERRRGAVTGVRYPREARLQTDHRDVIIRSWGSWHKPGGSEGGTEREARRLSVQGTWWCKLTRRAEAGG